MNIDRINRIDRMPEMATGVFLFATDAGRAQVAVNGQQERIWGLARHRSGRVLDGWWPDNTAAGIEGKGSCRKHMREDCVSVIALLERTPAAQWAEAFVIHKCSFWRKHCLGLIFSTIHGPDFFENVLQCMDGRTWEPENKGEYEENFRKFIKHHRQA